ncbi:MAG: hypothetical protein PHD41_06705 [Methanosarcinaceae archaeon]|nr:hypothetical protein [Methanosarcinaceae archaeon]MDD4749674.1 hypothetical protein [Methanosarcinaceae archaeon]
MDYKYDLQKKILFVGENKLPAYSLENNEVGSCSICDLPLLSLSYHSSEDRILVPTKCDFCGVFHVNIYSLGWIWLAEAPLSLVPIPIPLSNPCVNDLKGLEAISPIKLKAVFSEGEITALFTKARAETPIRQSLYRARKKYAYFEELFELKLEF